uniref:Uncharacterized protein n=1 Tax=Arundo donax TaxID=35708 RepID=A0A0A8ZYW7_ARUDO
MVRFSLDSRFDFKVAMQLYQPVSHCFVAA